MRLSWRRLLLAGLLGATLVAGTGCSGLNATGTVNPLMFFLPGAGVTPSAPADPESSTPAEPGLLLAQAF